MNKNFDKIKKYYDTGLWNEVRVKNMVIKGVILEEEYRLIIRKEYKE